jgi:ParB/RepB/Spo0J family partition protein
MVDKRRKQSPGDLPRPEFMRIPMDRILEPRLPARATSNSELMRDLIESMREVGQIEAIGVERKGQNFEIVTGHRRFLAARQLNWPDIAALVYRKDSTNRLAMMLHENTVREDLNPAEEALFMAQAKDELNLNEEELCKLFKRSPGYIGDRFALLRGDVEIFKALQAGQIRVGVAHQLNRITDENMRHYYLDCARRSDPPARLVAQWVSDWQLQNMARAGAGSAPPAGVRADGQLPVTVSGDAAAAGADGGGAPGVNVPRIECALCGGAKDPYNLINVMIHKWHWDEIIRAVERAQRGEV